MRSETVTAVVDGPANDVFDYLSRIESLPEWANEFARELRYDDGEAIVVNGLGEFVFRIVADAETGVIDMLVGPSKDELTVCPTRVVDIPGVGTTFTFTMFQLPGTPDELFESQHASLEREFENIRARFEADRRG